MSARAKVVALGGRLEARSLRRRRRGSRKAHADFDGGLEETWNLETNREGQGARSQARRQRSWPIADPTDGPYGQGVRPVNQREPEQARVPTARGDGALEVGTSTVYFDASCTASRFEDAAPARTSTGLPLHLFSAQRISALHSTSRTGVDDTTATQCPAGADLPASGPLVCWWTLAAGCHTRDASAADEPHKRF